ncbi:predicted protein [Postia placenta Mad-698-R]|uniref:L-dopachrome isomerase n=1 Tax=Postia placenta MAD-698-R-SB12 TaxID=670580 RepID=A0A1X6N888_9APHY|nr:hypothetical protein POSPLADRAFT_1044245 [Postia placenta MAD-698-R-SB12]EED81730.1 predicted protein [Postia placenta Mad-698-R]OSX64794.1 hypothetical protein POSPLADRAFT_1044245 [Postia placenta MAD-698-R-SB12]
MPSLVLKTNLAAKTLNKPEVYISVSYDYSENLTFNGSFDPTFLLTVTSLDNITPELNEGYSKVLYNFLESKLGIPGDRGYITFLDPGRAYMGYQGTTFGTIFGPKH